MPRIAGLVVFILFALTFDATTVQDDGRVYFDFLRKAFGVDTPAVAYQFGSAFWNAPFYAVSRLVAARGQLDAYRSAEAAIAVASNAATILALYFGWRILRELDLPRGPVVLLLTLFGTPLFFSAVLSPSGKHAADTLYATAAFWFVLRSTRPDARRRDFAAVGVCLALLLATRYANAALAIGVLTVFAVLRLRRAVSWIVATGAVTSVLLFGMPVVRHIPYGPPSKVYPSMPAVADAPAGLANPTQRLALGDMPIIDPVLRATEFSPTVPFKMLFTLHRGLFVWTPLTLFATVGFVLLVRRNRRHRPFLAALGVSSLALVAIHCFWGRQWDGGGSFSQRFLTALFPFFLVGTAEFVRRMRGRGVALLVLCASFSVWIGLVQYNGYYDQSSSDSVVQIVENYTGPYRKPPPHDSIGRFGDEMRVRIAERWQLYRALLS